MYNGRKIVIDEEMTGLDLAEGARLVEIGAVELMDGKPTGRTFHSYINPEGRPMSESAMAVTGLTDEFLATQPRFANIAEALQEFIGDSRIVIYCAIKKGGSPDESFLNNEMKMAGFEPFPAKQWLNMRYWAAGMFERGQGSLNSLLDNYGIDRASRAQDTGHGGMTDAVLTAALYPKLRADWAKFSKKRKEEKKAASIPQQVAGKKARARVQGL